MNTKTLGALNAWIQTMGLHTDQVLGVGSYATVYATTNPNLVAKFTTDDAEILAAKQVMDAQAKGLARGIVRIDAIKSLVYDDTWQGLMLVEERLKNLPDNLEEGVKRMGVTDLVKDTPYIRYPIIWNKATGHYEKSRNPFVDPWVWTTAVSLNMAQLIASCKEAGITSFGDFHSGNIMIRPGYGVVISDLGLTST